MENRQRGTAVQQQKVAGKAGVQVGSLGGHVDGHLRWRTGRQNMVLLMDAPAQQAKHGTTHGCREQSRQCRQSMAPLTVAPAAIRALISNHAM